MYEPEKPLDRRELRILRGMIDDYEYRRMHDTHKSEFWSTTKVILASAAALIALVIQCANVVFLFAHG